MSEDFNIEEECLLCLSCVCNMHMALARRLQWIFCLVINLGEIAVRYQCPLCFCKAKEVRGGLLSFRARSLKG